MNIEEVAAADPNAILQVPVDITKGLQPAQVKHSHIRTYMHSHLTQSLIYSFVFTLVVIVCM